MRIPRFYINNELESGRNIELPPDIFRHAIQVLRLQKGEELILFNGSQGEYHCALTEVAKRKATLTVLNYQTVNRESPLKLTLVQSIIKPDKMDFAIQKSTELGISAIQPLITQRSVVRPGRDKMDKKLAHWQAVAISACEQSSRTTIPEILPVLTLDTWIQQPVTPQALRLWLIPGAQNSFAELSKKTPRPSAISIMIGPEGGFTLEEERLCQENLLGIALGKRILRAETAATTATALAQHYFGDIQ